MFVTMTHDTKIPVVRIEYAVADRAAWHAGHLLARVPQRERDKCQRKGRRDKYASQFPSNHYGEVLSMIALDAEGWDWLYDEFYLFWNKRTSHDSFAERLSWMSRGEGVYKAGTLRLLEFIGKESMEALWRGAEKLRTADTWPVEPDLFAWREVDGRLRFRCIEVKVNTDPIRHDQLVGLELITEVLGHDCDVCVHHYAPRLAT